MDLWICVDEWKEQSPTIISTARQHSIWISLFILVDQTIMSNGTVVLLTLDVLNIFGQRPAIISTTRHRSIYKIWTILVDLTIMSNGTVMLFLRWFRIFLIDMYWWMEWTTHSDYVTVMFLFLLGVEYSWLICVEWKEKHRAIITTSRQHSIRKTLFMLVDLTILKILR